MPVVEIKMLSGRSHAQKAELAEKITDVMVDVAGAARDRVNVIFYDFDRTEWSVGGMLFSDKQQK